MGLRAAAVFLRPDPTTGRMTGTSAMAEVAEIATHAWRWVAQLPGAGEGGVGLTECWTARVARTEASSQGSPSQS